MDRTFARSGAAARALRLVEDLQATFVDALRALDPDARIEVATWRRDDGRHGGGDRRGTSDGAVFGRASINVSQVHYDDLPDARLGSATALSAIVHPTSPWAPSIHVHTSWTELRDAPGSWRVMADLNPSHPDPDDARRFRDAVRAAAPDLAAEAEAEGDRYFRIPALDRRRGVAHFYLEAVRTDDPLADEALARRVVTAAIGAWAAIVADALRRHPEAPDEAARARQLAYHTLYLYQVTTLDRGTTAGLLVHDQNDPGVLGSLPPQVSRSLLRTWAPLTPAPSDRLVDALVAALPAVDPTPIDEPTKRALAAVIRDHHRRHPEALALQASGTVAPRTVEAHLGRRT